jgi:hypothetical protein
LFWLAQQRNVENLFEIHIFCSELLLFVKKAHWNVLLDTFSSLQTFFSRLSLDIKFFANFSVEKTIRTPCNRAKFPASGVWDQTKCPFQCAILWRQIYY